MFRTAVLVSTAIAAIGGIMAEPAAARDMPTDFSAQQQQNRNTNQNRNVNQNVNRNVNQNVNRNVNQNSNRNANQNVNRNVNQNVNQNFNRNANQNVNRNVNQNVNQNFNRNANQNVNRNANQNVNRNANQNVNQNVNRNANQNFNRNTNQNVNRNTNQNVNQNVNRNANQNFNRNTNQNFNRNVDVNRNVNQNVNRNINTRNGRAVLPGPRGANIANQGNLTRGPGMVGKRVHPDVTVVRLNNRVAPIWREGPRRTYWGGRWRTFVPVAAIGAVAIGGAYYFADGYVSVARPYCDGLSPEGCRLNWQRVDFEDGDSDWQCVQFCPRAGSPPPARTVALAAPPPPLPADTKCELTIYPEPNFGGTAVTTSDEQPALSESGWQNQISSVKVISGTWDFFNQEEFAGENLRLEPGEYPNLGPDWTRKAGSFMCIQP